MKRKGRLAAVLGLVSVPCILGAAALSSPEVVREWFWIYRLRAGGKDERARAAARLADLHSLRAVPHLIQVIQEDEGESLTVQWGRFVQRCSKGAPRRMGRVPRHLATPAVHALSRLGEAAHPALRRALATEERSPHPSARVRSTLERLLHASAPPPVLVGTPADSGITWASAPPPAAAR